MSALTASKSNRSEGTAFEKEFCEMLADRGFWAHNFAQTAAGQPADVIALKRHSVWLIDCKVMSSSRFPLSRIEPNQLSAMEHWAEKTSYMPYFAIRLKDGAVYMLDYGEVRYYIDSGCSSISEIEIRKYGMYFGAWVEGVEQLC